MDENVVKVLAGAAGLTANIVGFIYFSKKKKEKDKSQRTRRKVTIVRKAVFCQNCNIELDADEEMIGEVLPCPNCNYMTKVKKTRIQ